MLRVAQEAVHRAAVDVLLGGLLRVSQAAVARDLAWVMERANASAQLRIGHAHGGMTVAHGDPVGARIGAEVGVKRAVLLHHDDHVPDLVNACLVRHGRLLRALGRDRGEHRGHCTHRDRDRGREPKQAAPATEPPHARHPMHGNIVVLEYWLGVGVTAPPRSNPTP